MKNICGKALSILAVLASVFLVACGDGNSAAKAARAKEVEGIIAQAQTMTFDELAKKAIEESKGKDFFGLGNTSRGKDALPKFIKRLQQIDPTYSLSFNWQQPKNNKIYDQLIADAAKEKGTFAMTLIQDGTQFKPKMLDTGYLKRFVPKEWAKANGITNLDEYKGYVPLLVITKIFMANCCGDVVFKNCWDFVYKGVRPLFMYAATETVGMNFLYLLTTEKYSEVLKDAFEALPVEKQSYFMPIIEDLAKDAEEFKLGPNGKYALAYIKLWMKQYNGQTDDGPICNILINKSSKNQCGLLVYSKLRSVVESDNVSLNNIKIPAYEEGYKGFSGYGYSHYLFVTTNSPLPWTACAFINFMTTQEEGFEAWGKDMGCYSTNPEIDVINEGIYHHKTAGIMKDGKVYEAKNDRGKNWWCDPKQGCLVMEDVDYCSRVAFTIGRWVDLMAE